MLTSAKIFAKICILGGEKGGRMLDLLTGQVSQYSSEPCNTFSPGDENEVSFHNSQQFRIDDNFEDSKAYTTFLTHMASCQEKRNKIPTDNHQTTRS